MKKGIPKELKRIGLGLPIFIGLNIAIKFFVYIPIANSYSLGIGILLMFLASFILRYLIILIYDYFKEDVLLVESFKENLEIKQHTYATKQIIKSQKSGNKYLLHIGVVCFDPVVTVLFFREGFSKWNNIPDKKTLILFTISVIFCVSTIALPIYGVFGLIDLIK